MDAARLLFEHFVEHRPDMGRGFHGGSASAVNVGNDHPVGLFGSLPQPVTHISAEGRSADESRSLSDQKNERLGLQQFSYGIHAGDPSAFDEERGAGLQAACGEGVHQRREDVRQIVPNGIGA